MEIKPVARIRTDFPEKFGIPRQSGLAAHLPGRIVFEKEFANPDAVRGLEGFDYIWLIWEFSGNRHGGWSPTVRPPRLGGNTYMGVFATRSPFRPNPLGLSAVKVTGIVPDGPDGPEIHVCGADLMDGTPIYDIKPYIRYADCHPDAACGYVDSLEERHLEVVFPEGFTDEALKEELSEVLSLDPRPSYQDDPQRSYGLSFRGHNVRFRVDGGVLYVMDITTI